MYSPFDNYRLNSYNQSPIRYTARINNQASFTFDTITPLNTEVDFERPELVNYLPKYTKIRDCLLGEDHIKSLGETYLPRPTPEKDVEEERRYRNYLLRANFLNATGFTQRTTVGKLFAKPATIDLPQALEPLRANVNGEGLAFDQMIELIAGEVFAFGRAGLYADFNETANTMVSIADVETLSPTLSIVRPEDIINWRIDRQRRKLIMVVVREWFEDYNQFAVVLKPQYRVFRLDPNLTVQIWRPQSALAINSDTRYYLYTTYQPTLPGGVPWTVIPFSIMGASNNDWVIDEPPLSLLANLDIALFRNSADYEEAAFLVGQPTAYVSGMTQAYAKELGITRFRMGSGRFLPLKDGSSKVGLLQANAETLLTWGMDDKNSKMRQLGSTIQSVDNLADDQTATGSVYQALQVHAPLVTTSRNVIAGVRKALGFAAMYLGIDPESDEMNVKLNSDILDITLGLAGLQTTLQLYEAGVLTLAEVREQLRIQGLTLFDLEEAKKILDEEREARMPATLATDRNFGSAPGAAGIRDVGRSTPNRETEQ